MAVSKKKRIFQAFLLIGTVVSLYFVPWDFVRAWIVPLPDTVQAQVDARANFDYDGMLVYVQQGDNLGKTYVSGWHDRDKKIPAKPDALFKIASIGKLFTAASLAKLHVAKKLSLDSTLAYYLPQYKDRIANADRISLRLMVQHRSGLFNYSDTPRYWENPAISQDQRLGLIFDKPANFEPGTDYEYSNTNYFLLGMIMDKVLEGKSYAYIQTEILDPLGMKNTYESVNKVDADRIMGGYHLGYPHNLKADDLGMIATAEDIGIFVRALNVGTLLNPTEQKTYSEIYEFKHSGWVPGYQSFAEYHPDIDAVVVLFNNTTDKDLFLWNLSEIFYSRIVKIIGRNP